MTDPISDLWTRQHQDARPPSPEALVRAHARLRRRIWWRDALEYVAGTIGIAAFVNVAVKAPDWGIRIGSAAIILGMLVVFANLWRRRIRAPDDALAGPSLAFHRAQLVAQRDALASVWRWYLGPLVPGMAIFLAGVAHSAAGHMPLGAALLGAGAAALPIAAVFYGIHRINRFAARRLQHRIDALDRNEL